MNLKTPKDILSIARLIQLRKYQTNTRTKEKTENETTREKTTYSKSQAYIN